MASSRAFGWVVWAVPAFVVVACGVPDFSGFDGTGGADASSDAKSDVTGGVGGTGGTSGSDAGGTGGTSDAGDAATLCSSDAECSGSTPRCEKGSGKCVACLPSDDQCPAGQYCAPSFNCAFGCKSASECNADAGAGPLSCTGGKCLGCQTDDDCAPGKICNTTTTECVPGCSATHACQSGYDCCSGSCALLSFDVNHCGTCDTVCPPNPPNATPKCAAGKCGLTCDFLRANCNNDPTDGCEVDVSSDPANCGGCNKPCASGQTCTNQKCG